MVAARRIIALSVDTDQRRTLVEVARSRTEPVNRVERAGIILAYLDEPSAYAVARAMGVSQKTVTRCLQRAAELGVLAALDDRARTGREARITAEARTWLVGLACAKPTQFGYPHELWTTRLLAAHARDHGPRAGHPSLANLAQGTVCKILAAHEVKPHRVRHYLQRRDHEFEPKMAEVLCVYREVAMRRAAPGGAAREPAVAVISYDEKPGIQAIGAIAPDLRPVTDTHPTIRRGHEYRRHGTVTLMAGIDLLTGQVHAFVKDRHRSREFIEFLNMIDFLNMLDAAVRFLPTRSSRRGGQEWLLRVELSRSAAVMRMAALARLGGYGRGGVILLCPGRSDSQPIGYGESVVDLKAQIAHRAL